MEPLPTPPPLAAHVWRYFRQIRSELSPNGVAPPKITRHDIHAWEQDEQISLQLWERRAIMELDLAYLASLAEAQAKNKPKGD